MDPMGTGVVTVGFLLLALLAAVAILAAVAMPNIRRSRESGSAPTASLRTERHTSRTGRGA